MTLNTHTRNSSACQPLAKGAPHVLPGARFYVLHPFCWELANRPSGDADGPITMHFMSWRPGVRFALRGPWGDSETIADGRGCQVLTVESVHKPGRFPERVFYTRKWIDPRHLEFGKGRLRITTMAAFRSIVRGYRHEYRLATAEEFTAHEADELAKAAAIQ